MRSRWTVLAAAAAIGFAPLPALAGDDVEAQLRQMNERMSQLEQQLQATNEELAASKQRVEEQQAVIQNLDEDRDASSGLSRFLSETEFSGLVAASYTYNFKNLGSSAVGLNGNSTTAGENLGLYGLTSPHNQNSNSFQLDQLAFRMKKTPTPESRAGWGASLAWGASADSAVGRTSSDANSSLPDVVEAYATYLFDLGEGVQLLGGRYLTPAGGESFWENENFNITRGLLWTLQPVTFTGAYLAGKCECGLFWQLGAANGYGNVDGDTDSEPTFVGEAGYTADKYSFRLGGVYGGNIDDVLAPLATFGFVVPGTDYATGNRTNDDKIGQLDAVLTWNPSDALSTWVNFDYWWLGDTDPDPITGFNRIAGLNIWGIAGAGRYAITEATGFSLRYEYMAFNGGSLGGIGDSGSALMSLTGTLDHHLTDNLIVRAEGRLDKGDGFDGQPDDFFVTGHGLGTSTALTPAEFSTSHQVLGLVQLMYVF